MFEKETAATLGTRDVDFGMNSGLRHGEYAVSWAKVLRELNQCLTKGKDKKTSKQSQAIKPCTNLLIPLCILVERKSISMSFPFS